MMTKKHAASLAALALSGLHFASFDVFSRPIVSDVRFFLYYAWQVSEGAVPHLDFFENKPQLSTFVGALFYELGDFAGVDPLLAIRWAFLAFAATGGVLSFWIFRRLGRGSAIAGVLGLLAYCSFGLLGVMPAVGNVPKLLMALLASGMVLLAHDRRWFLAGLAGALAFMDWQIGALVWLAAFASAALFENPRRPALLAVASGGAVGIAPFLLYYALNGALVQAFRQVIIATFFRGSVAQQSENLGDRLTRIAEMIEKACPDQEWIFFASLLGLFALLRWIVWEPDRDRNRLLLPLCIYHGGLLAFSLVDFQRYGDFFVMLHSMALLWGLAWLALFELGTRFLATHFSGRAAASRAFGALILIAAVAAARPAFLRPELELESKSIEAGGTLADQREVSALLTRQTRDKTLVLMDSSELLFLMRYRNPLPNVYMNRATRAHYSSYRDEPVESVATRLLRSVDPDVFIESPMARAEASFVAEYSRRKLSSKNGKYTIKLLIR
jgi:hypothetical protein